MAGRDNEIKDRADQHEQPAERQSRFSAFFSKEPPDGDHPALIHFSSTPLFRLEQCPDRYVHILKKKDQEHIVPLVNYFISRVGHVVYLGGDCVRNVFSPHGRRNYKVLNLLLLMNCDDVEKYSNIMNNIISSNDGAFSLGLRYRVSKNRNKQGCFREIALARYVIEPRLEGCEKLLYPLRASPIEVDFTTPHMFSLVFDASSE